MALPSQHAPHPTASADPMALLRTRLEQLSRPIRYATQRDFVHLPKLRDLEAYVRHQAEAMQTLPLPASLQPLLLSLVQVIDGFDALPLDTKQERLREVLDILARMQELLQTPAGATLPALPETLSPTPTPPALPQPPSSSGAANVTAADPLNQAVQFIRGVGPKRASLLARMGLHTVNDLLWSLPVRYEDRRQFTPLGLLRCGWRETFCGTTTGVQLHTRPHGKAFATLFLEDRSGLLVCKWFQTRGLALQERFPPGTRLVGHGLITLNPYTGGREVVHPDLEIVEDDDPASVHFGRLVPIYPLTAGLPQKSMRSLMYSVMETYLPQVRDPLPPEVRQSYRLPPLADSLRQVHFPTETAPLDTLNEHATPWHERLIFEEFFLLELGLALRHYAVQQVPRPAPYAAPNHLGEALLQHLPFQLTGAQQRVLAEVLLDMQRPYPMNRLIQGDVGSGKTIVALLAMLLAVSNDFQAALMAPTEILAEQHLATLRRFVQPLELQVALLTGAVKGKSRQQLLERIAQGEVRLLVGTHALLYEGVQFHRLGMIVVDEQHRFGVMQRAGLRQKGLTPDVLVMTATPIPRTLAMTLYGDLDLSLLDELPPGRLPVKTELFSPSRRERTYELIRREVRKGHQAYIVYPLIEESETLDLGAAVAMASHLQQDIFPQHRVGLLHGRLSSDEKEAMMQAFVQGTFDILVATTVIEVGVDVPNATIMVIENAERFGLAQLHQLRGRVGRGSDQATCILLAGEKLSKEGRRRLRVMQESTDGFYVAEQDLQIRGPGELLGTRQAGLPTLRVGNVLHHGDLLEQARRAAFALLAADPHLLEAEHQHLMQAIHTRWGGRFELATIG